MAIEPNKVYYYYYYYKVVSKVGMAQAVMSLTKHAHTAELNMDIHIHSDCVEWMTFW